MGIRFECPNGHKLNVKAFLAGKRGICPECDARFLVPTTSGVRAEALPPGTPDLHEPAPTPEQTPEVLKVDLSLARTAADTPRLRHLQIRRSRRQRAWQATVALGGLILLLAVVLVLVLWQQS